VAVLKASPWLSQLPSDTAVQLFFEQLAMKEYYSPGPTGAFTRPSRSPQ
jgi:hypothetical protein